MDYPEDEGDDFLIKTFAQKLCDATAWFEHARALIGSARISKQRASLLINQIEKSALENVCSLLYGLALENLFKAVWIYKQFGTPYTEEWLPKSDFPQEIKTHNLLNLANLINPELAKEHKFSLKLLTEAVTWSGRYPCGIEPLNSIHVRSSDVHDHAEKIYEKYRKYFTISS